MPSAVPGRDRSNRFAAFIGFWVHARTFNFAQKCVHLHDSVKQPLGRVVTRIVAHVCQNVQIHSSRKIRLALVIIAPLIASSAMT
jgi:hypothetical protein